MISFLLTIFSLSSQAAPALCMHLHEDLEAIKSKMDLSNAHLMNAEDLSGVGAMEESDQLIKLQKEYEATMSDCKKSLN